jgi:dihydrofolate reductase
MRSVTYSMSVSLDGYIVGPDGDFGWTAPDEEVFRFVTDEIRQVGVHLMGRRLSSQVVYLRHRVSPSPTSMVSTARARRGRWPRRRRG